MDWKQFALNLLVMAGVYILGYGSSYFFSKKYAIKKNQNKSEKHK